MFFHFVKKGDTLSSIASSYQVKESDIINDNSLINPGDLVINQCLLINNNSIYIIKEGDTLNNIANKYNTSIQALKSINPDLGEIIYPGQKIKINSMSSSKTKAIFNGYCYSGSNLESIKKALNSLTYLSIFSYLVREDGNLSIIDDEKFIKLAKDNGVKPIMVITNSKEKGGFSPDLASKIINNQTIIDTLLLNIERTIKTKGYYGLNIDFEYVNQGDKYAFINFVKKASAYFKQRNIYLSISLAPKYKDDQKGLLYEAHDYQELGKLVDNVILMTYEWGYTFGPAMAVAPYNEISRVLKYATSKIDSKKILMGIPNYGYDFIIPYKQGQRARSISNNKAIPIAFDNHAEIKHSPISRTPYFKYKKDNVMHEVHFDDPYSIEEKLSLIDDYHLGGGSIWTISTPIEYIYLLINNGYFIQK